MERYYLRYIERGDERLCVCVCVCVIAGVRKLIMEDDNCFLL